MLNLMKLESRRNNIRSYLLAAVATLLLVIGFLYLFAYVPQLSPEDPDLALFMTYNNVISLSLFICMAVFCVLSAVMYARFVIEEYSGKRAGLLFSYPVSRGKILFAKLAFVFLFTVLGSVLCSVIALGIFCITESIAPMMADTLSAGMILHALKGAVVMAVIAPCLGIVATGLGFVKKSVPTTIVAAVAMVSVLGNILSAALSNSAFLYVLLGISAGAALLVGAVLTRQVNNMEVL